MGKKKKDTSVVESNIEKKLSQTEIVVVLDRSGSMKSISKSTVDGFNSFLFEQQNAEDEGFVTLVQFDDRYEVNYNSVPAKEVSQLVLGETYTPRGRTALLDAIGTTIEQLKTDRDVVFVIITDGEENASRTYTKDAIFKMIDTLTKDGWKFLFLGANQDAIKSGGALGIRANQTMTYAATDFGAENVFSAMSANVSSYRMSKGDMLKRAVASGTSGGSGTSGLSGISLDELTEKLEFSIEQREVQQEEIKKSK
jgi:von Willebrand factor type A domain